MADRTFPAHRPTSDVQRPIATTQRQELPPSLHAGERPVPARRIVILAFAAVYITWGSTYLGIAFAIRTIPVFLMGAMRFMVAGLALIAVSASQGNPRPTGRQLRSAAIAGFLLLTVGNTTVVWAETRVASGTAALLVTTPLWLVLMEWMRGHRPTKGVVLGLIMGALGIVILVGPQRIAGAGPVNLIGAIVLIMGSVFWAAGSIYSRYAPLPSSPLLTTGLQMVFGSAALFVVAGMTGEIQHFRFAQVSALSWLGFGYLIVFGSWVGYTAYIWLMRNVPTEHAATYAFVCPIIAVILGWALNGEPLSIRTAVAATIIIGAVAAITLKQEPEAKIG